MNNNELVKQASQFGNVLAYDPRKPAPAGFERVKDLSVDSPNGLKLTTFYNAQTNQIAVAVAGTNDLKDVAGYPELYFGYGSNKAQIDEATGLFKKIQKFAHEETANVLISGHSFGGLFVDIGASTYDFQGVKFDGVGGKSVLNDNAYQAQLQSLGIAPSSGGNVVSVGVNGFFNQVFGGGLVEYFGLDLANTSYCTVNTDRGLTSGVLNLLGTVALGLLGYLTTRLASAGYDHNSDSINSAMQNDKFTCTWIEPPTPISTPNTVPSMENVLSVDKQLDTLHNQGVLNNNLWNDYTQWSTGQLVNDNLTIKRVLTMGVIVCVTAFAPQHTIAQQAALPIQESQAPTEQSTDLSLGLSQNEFYSNVDVLTCGKVSLVVSSVCEIEENNSIDPYCFSQTVNLLTKNGRIKTYDYHYKKTIARSFIYGASCIYHNGEYYFYLTNSNLGSCKNCEWNDFFHSNGSYLGSSAWINSWTSFKRKMINEKYEIHFINKKEKKLISITTIKNEGNKNAKPLQ